MSTSPKKSERRLLEPAERSLVGRRLTALRSAFGHQQQTWAIELKLTPSQISRWEGGKSEPDLATLIQIARLCGISTDWILTGQLQLRVDPRTEAYLRLHAPDLFCSRAVPSDKG